MDLSINHRVEHQGSRSMKERMADQVLGKSSYPDRRTRQALGLLSGFGPNGEHRKARRPAHDVRSHSHCHWQVTFNVSHLARLPVRTLVTFQNAENIIRRNIFACLCYSCTRKRGFCRVVLFKESCSYHLQNIISARRDDWCVLISDRSNLHSIGVGLWSDHLKSSIPR